MSSKKKKNLLSITTDRILKEAIINSSLSKKYLKDIRKSKKNSKASSYSCPQCDSISGSSKSEFSKSPLTPKFQIPDVKVEDSSSLISESISSSSSSSTTNSSHDIYLNCVFVESKPDISEMESLNNNSTNSSPLNEIPEINLDLRSNDESYNNSELSSVVNSFSSNKSNQVQESSSLTSSSLEQSLTVIEKKFEEDCRSITVHDVCSIVANENKENTSSSHSFVPYSSITNDVESNVEKEIQISNSDKHTLMPNNEENQIDQMESFRLEKDSEINDSLLFRRLYTKLKGKIEKMDTVFEYSTNEKFDDIFMDEIVNTIYKLFKRLKVSFCLESKKSRKRSFEELETDSSSKKKKKNKSKGKEPEEEAEIEVEKEGEYEGKKKKRKKSKGKEPEEEEEIAVEKEAEYKRKKKKRKKTKGKEEEIAVEKETKKKKKKKKKKSRETKDYEISKKKSKIEKEKKTDKETIREERKKNRQKNADLDTYKTLKKSKKRKQKDKENDDLYQNPFLFTSKTKKKSSRNQVEEMKDFKLRISKTADPETCVRGRTNKKKSTKRQFTNLYEEENSFKYMDKTLETNETQIKESLKREGSLNTFRKSDKEEKTNTNSDSSFSKALELKGLSVNLSLNNALFKRKILVDLSRNNVFDQHGSLLKSHDILTKVVNDSCLTKDMFQTRRGSYKKTFEC